MLFALWMSRQHSTRLTMALFSAVSTATLASMLKPLPGFVCMCQIGSSSSHLGNMLLTRRGAHVACHKDRCSGRWFLWRMRHQSATSSLLYTVGQVACSTVDSRLDYCNALLYGAPVEMPNKPQRAQNNLARVVCQRNGRSDAKPLPRSLHWLPARHRITYKMAVLTHKVLATSTPAYLSDLTSVATPARHLRSSHAPLLTMLRTRTDIARRAFSVVAPSVWSSLPDTVLLCNSTDAFK